MKTRTLRIENVAGEITLITEYGEVVPADMVTIRMQRGRATSIKTESKEAGPRFGSYTRFFANAESDI